MFNVYTSCSGEVVDDADNGFDLSHHDEHLSDGNNVDFRSGLSEVLTLILKSDSALGKNVINSEILTKVNTTEKLTEFVKNFYVKFLPFSDEVELKPRLKGGGSDSDEDSDGEFYKAMDNLKHAIKKADTSARKKIKKEMEVATEQMNTPCISASESRFTFTKLLSSIKSIASVLLPLVTTVMSLLSSISFANCVIF